MNPVVRVEKKDIMKYDDNYDTCEQTYSTLRVYSGDISPNIITIKLNIDPSSTQEKGKFKRFGKMEKEIKKNGWFLTSENQVESKDTRRHIDWIINHIKSKKK